MIHTVFFKSLHAIAFATVTFLFFVTITNSRADEGLIRIKLTVGYASYSSPYNSSLLISNYATQGLGVTYIWPSNFYVDFSTKINGANATYNAKSVFATQVTDDQKFTRTENTLTIGTPLANGLQANAGIFKSDTIYDIGTLGDFSQKITGLTAGLGKGFLIEEGRAGSFGLSGAFALLNAVNKNWLGASENSNISYGVSVGAVYNYAISRGLNISADTKFQTYFITYPTFSGDERIFSTSLSLVGQF